MASTCRARACAQSHTAGHILNTLRVFFAHPTVTQEHRVEIQWPAVEIQWPAVESLESPCAPAHRMHVRLLLSLTVDCIYGPSMCRARTAPYALGGYPASHMVNARLDWPYGCTMLRGTISDVDASAAWSIDLRGRSSGGNRPPRLHRPRPHSGGNRHPRLPLHHLRLHPRR